MFIQKLTKLTMHLHVNFVKTIVCIQYTGVIDQ